MSFLIPPYAVQFLNKLGNKIQKNQKLLVLVFAYFLDLKISLLHQTTYALETIMPSMS